MSWVCRIGGHDWETIELITIKSALVYLKAHHPKACKYLYHYSHDSEFHKVASRWGHYIPRDNPDARVLAKNRVCLRCEKKDPGIKRALDGLVATGWKRRNEDERRRARAALLWEQHESQDQEDKTDMCRMP
jgi:hypothetical protein